MIIHSMDCTKTLRLRIKDKHANVLTARESLQPTKQQIQFSTQLLKNNAATFVGDVASAKLVKTKKAKSTYTTAT